MKKYVVGIVFNEHKILLIRKNRPTWQAGGLNGVGGKVKEYENFYDAMVRECSEECNLVLTSWAYLGLLTDNINYEVQYFRAFAPSFEIVRTNTDEAIEIYNISELNYGALIPPTDIFVRLAMYSVYSPIELIVEWIWEKL